MTSRVKPPRHKRVDVNLEFDSAGQFIREYVTNVSRSGAFVRTNDPLPVGTKVRLKFTLMLDDPEILEGVGQVVRVNQRPRGMGVVFLELDRVSQGILEKLLTRPVQKRA